MYDAFFTFSKRAEQVNQARFGVSLSYTPTSNLTIREIAGASSADGITKTFYTDTSCNNYNITLDSNVTSGTFNMSAFANHSLALLRFTNPGPPVPSIFYDSNNNQYANHTQEFHGTCKPVSMGDWVRHSSVDAILGSNFDNVFITAGYDGTNGCVGINVNKITESTTTTITLSNLAWCNSGLPGNTINSNSQIRLFAHPDWFVGGQRGILLIGWDNSSNIFLESYNWDGSNLNSAANGNLGATSNNMEYTGQHDIHYMNSGNILLQTWDSSHSTGTLFEIDGGSLAVVSSKSTSFVGYDYAADVVCIQRGGDFNTFKNTAGTGGKTTLAAGVSDLLVGAFASASSPYDAIFHTDESFTMYVSEYDSTLGITSHRFNYNGAGVISAHVSFTQTTSSLNGVNLTQIERTSPDVLINSVGPNHSNVPLIRSVCDSGIFRGTSTANDYSDTAGTFYEDITQMKHTKSQDYTLTRDRSIDSTIGGNNHLICATYYLDIGCYGQNWLQKHYEMTNTSGSVSGHHNYILYLGYKNDSATADSYCYIAVSGIGHNFYSGLVTGSPVSGLLHWVKFRNN